MLPCCSHHIYSIYWPQLLTAASHFICLQTPVRPHRMTRSRGNGRPRWWLRQPKAMAQTQSAQRNPYNTPFCSTCYNAALWYIQLEDANIISPSSRVNSSKFFSKCMCWCNVVASIPGEVMWHVRGIVVRGRHLECMPLAPSLRASVH